MSALAVLAVLLHLCLTAYAACSDLKFASSYADHMVLQRDQYVTVWGYAPNVGDEVSVILSGANHEVLSTTEANEEEGVPVWRVRLSPKEATSAASVITASITGCSISINDVLFGDVWICAGQSNMDFYLQKEYNSAAELAAVGAYPSVRRMKVATSYSSTAKYDLTSIALAWDLPTSSNMGLFSAVCWLYGRRLFEKLGVPQGLIQAAWGGTRIEAWSSAAARASCTGGQSGTGKQTPGGLWNSMIHPLLQLSIKGAIWYQGEANRYVDASTYACQFPAMISDWRSNWHSSTQQATDATFPFGAVQLAPYKVTTSFDFPDLRWAQAAGQSLAKVFMAVAIDLPDISSPYGAIHPRYKDQIAERLALGAYQVAYDITNSGRYKGPVPTAYAMSGGSIQVTYDNGAKPITVHTSTTSNTGFEVCCASSETYQCSTADSAWTSTGAPVPGQFSVLLSNPCSSGQSVTGLRYSWSETPCPLLGCPVYSVENNLPAPPFLHEGLIN